MGEKATLIYARNRETSCLQLPDGIQLYAEQGGWHIYGLGNPSKALLSQFQLEADARYTVKTLHKLNVQTHEDMVAVGTKLAAAVNP
jgi:hypothetical protein